MNHEETLESLETELEFQKNRFTQATRKLSDQIPKKFPMGGWIRNNPVQTALFMLVSGFVSAQVFYTPLSKDLNNP